MGWELTQALLESERWKEGDERGEEKKGEGGAGKKVETARKEDVVRPQ